MCETTANAMLHMMSRDLCCTDYVFCKFQMKEQERIEKLRRVSGAFLEAWCLRGTQHDGRDLGIRRRCTCLA